VEAYGGIEHTHYETSMSSHRLYFCTLEGLLAVLETRRKLQIITVGRDPR